MGSGSNVFIAGSGNGAVDKGVDFAYYFCTHAFLYCQKEMFSDRVRMDAYYNAIFRFKHHFHGKETNLVSPGDLHLKQLVLMILS